jgi:hypothetical protein
MLNRSIRKLDLVPMMINTMGLSENERVCESAFCRCLHRKKINKLFQVGQLEKIANNVEVVLADNSSNYKKLLTMTAEASGNAWLQNKLVGKKQLSELIKECRRIEYDREAIVLTHPVIAVWGIKPE